MNERVRFHFRIEQSFRARSHELHQLLQVIGESHVRGVALRYGLREGLGLQCRPFGLYALPGIGHAKRFAEVGIQRVHRGNLLLNLFLLRDYVAAARGVTAQKDERAAAVSEDLSLHGTQTLQVARAIELITGLAHLRIGETQVEEANQRGRNGHREDEPSEFLPELEAVEDLSDHQYGPAVRQRRPPPVKSLPEIGFLRTEPCRSRSGGRYPATQPCGRRPRRGRGCSQSRRASRAPERASLRRC